MNFGKRDIALYIPDEVGDVASLRHTKDSTADEVESLKPKLDPTKKVTRYWPGKAPKWVDYYEDNDKDFLGDAFTNKQTQESEPPKPSSSARLDPRLARLQRSAEQGEDSDTGPRIRRRIHEAEVIEAASDDSSESEDEEPFQAIAGDVLYGDAAEEEDEDEEEIALRRERIRERLRMKQREKEEEELLAKEKEQQEVVESDSGKDSSEWETDTDESEEEEGQVLKPIFVPKNQRETIKEAERKAYEEQVKMKKNNLKKEEEKRRTREMIAQIIRKESEQVGKHLDGNDSENEMPDDRDDLDEALEYEAWKVRELQRIKRDKDERQQLDEDKKETERRRNLTDEQRRMEDRMSGKNKEKVKAKWKYLQKYYHKGVFYMDEDSLEKEDVRARTYDAPTLEDKFDKQALPAVMQVKKFGRSGQTKYTHLVDQDTTTWDNPWTQASGRNEQYYAKLSGVGDLDSAGRKRKKI